MHAATVQTGHDMHAGLASLTIWPDPLSVLQLCISVDFVSYKVRRGNLERALLRLEQTLLEKLCGILYEGKLLNLLTLACRDLGSSSLVVFKAVLIR